MAGLLKLTQNLLLWLILLPALVIAAPVIFSLYLLRKVVDLIVTKLLHPDWTPILPPDSTFAHGLVQTDSEGRCLGNVCPISVMSEEIPIEEVREEFKKRLTLLLVSYKVAWSSSDMSASRLGQWTRFCLTPRKLMGYYYWVPQLIDLSKHIWEYKGQENLDDYLMTWLSMGYEGRPPWEIMMARPTVGKFANKTVACLKINHVMGDGMVILSFWLQFLHGPSKTKLETPLQPHIPTTWGQLLYQIIQFPRILHRLLGHKKALSLTEWFDKSNVQTELLKFKTINWIGVVSLSSAKLIARSTQVSLRSVLACSFGSALRKFILETRPSSDLPEQISCLIPIPWIHKPRAGTEDLMSNHSTSLFYMYPLRIESSMERMKITHESITDNFRGGMDRFIYYCTWLGYLLPAPFQGGYISISINSVDLPSMATEPLFLNRYPTLPCRVGFVGLPPKGSSYAVDCFAIFTSNSDDSSITISLTANTELIPDESTCQRVCIYFNEEIEELLIKVKQNGPSLSTNISQC